MKALFSFQHINETEPRRWLVEDAGEYYLKRSLADSVMVYDPAVCKWRWYRHYRYNPGTFIGDAEEKKVTLILLSLT